MSLSIAWTVVKPKEESVSREGQHVRPFRRTKEWLERVGLRPGYPGSFWFRCDLQGPTPSTYRSSSGKGRIMSPQEKLLSDKIEKETQVLRVNTLPISLLT